MQNETLVQKFLNKIATEGVEEVLKTAPAELLRDKDFMLAAVSNSGYALEYASEELRADKEVVLAAVQRSGRDALKYASSELQNDPDVLAAISE
jgi:hypothetical protein